ncbi:MAG: hypothetical protein ABJN95_16990 [Maribacter sp.]|uniref:hypothetical protein n=1 Tax=Maribacter sp. TaxID=1897614 RepID=UPI003296E974
MSKKKDELENWKDLIDSRNLTDKEKIEERLAIRKARAARGGKGASNDTKA